MRFFLLSLVINLLLLLIPLKSNDIKQEPKQKIVVTLKLSEKKVKSAPKLKPKPKEVKKIEKKKVVKPKKKIVKKRPKKKKATQKKIVKKKIVKKKVAKKIKPKKVEKVIVEKKVEKSQPIKTPIVSKEIVKEPLKISAPTNRADIMPVKSGKVKKEFCKEGVDFVVLKRPNLSYPKRALRMRVRKSVHVDVYFRVKKDGSIEILKAEGGSGIFQKEAVKRTKKMKIKLLDLNALKCKIIQPFRFEP